MIKIDIKMMDELSRLAKLSPRMRQNRNFHTSYDDPVNRMLNAVEPEAYFPPHRHLKPPKREVFIIFRGRATMIEFDEGGGISDLCVLDAREGRFAAEVAPGVWHSIVPLEQGTVLYEIKDGPYDKNSDKEFAPWAPSEQDPSAAKYVSGLLSRISLHS
ncbi:MAG: WbuC family cupin fold metalloprotein [Candidatus Omnitrophica bacterium]|jgi:cupin fold WbuC family metalloprotein|nr:WbuC family cupin fold metalloprotein [Candidatus Omnitrophota bacterium]